MYLNVEGEGTQPPRRIVRLNRTRFIPNTTLNARVFLNMRCADRALGCTSVSASECTVSVRCLEQRTTCGDEGECVPFDLDTLPGRDAGAPDIVTPPADVPSGRVDSAVIDGTDPGDVASVDAATDRRDVLAMDASADESQGASLDHESSPPDIGAEADRDASPTDSSGVTDADDVTREAFVPFVGGPADPLTVGAGTNHTCVLAPPVAGMTAGVVRCWGSSVDGVLGERVMLGAASGPVTAAAGRTFVELAVGSSSNCGRTERGEVYCWGRNASGQLGNGTTVSSAAAVAATGITDAVQVSVGLAHACVVHRAGGVSCWGANADGQAGSMTMGMPVTTPTRVTGADDVIEVRAGDRYTCGRRRGGGVYCWGSNVRGTLGTNYSVTSSATPVSVNAIDDATWLSVGRGWSCAGRASGQVWCWGANNLSQLALPPGRSEYGEPVPVPAPAGALRFTAYSNTTVCAWTATGVAYCWGSNASGQLGLGTAIDFLTAPTRLPSMPGPGAIDEIAAGDTHLCVLRRDGGVACAGNSTGGLLGRSTVLSVATPTTVPLGAVSELALGSAFGCTRDGAGATSCWGSNLHGTLGDGTGQSRFEPVSVRGLTATQLAASFWSACALVSGRAPVCWGRNQSGQLGDGTRVTRAAPVPVNTPHTDWTRIRPSAAFSCGLRSTGEVLCWGANALGQLADGTIVDHYTPDPVLGLPAGVVDIAVGDTHACAPTDAGGMFCWGSNGFGQLGAGVAGGNALRPTPVLARRSGPALDGVQQIAAGNGFSCAIRTDGQLFCWGSNASRALGTGGTNVAEPTLVRDAGTVASVATHPNGSLVCARRVDQSVACWGTGPIGDGSASASTPVTLAGLTAVNVRVGQTFACARRPDATVACWGANTVGEQRADPGWTLAPVPGL
jgi:alpha-tubulin suppressor-like RCC1 family protein